MNFMDLASIDIAAYSTAKALGDAQSSSGVKVLNKQRSQQEAVANILLSSIAETPRAPEQSGQNLDIQA